jgi:hypothetical protein
MAIQVSIQYRGHNVTYDVTTQEEGVYKLCRISEQKNEAGEYIPEKVIIRRKGKIWVSDMEDRLELTEALTKEICQFTSENYNAA